MAEQSFTCKGCGGQFNGRKRLYCTTKCREETRRRLKGILPRPPAACHQTHTCFWCGSNFQPKRKGRDKYCSRECFFSFQNAKSKLMEDLSASHEVHRRKCANCGCRFTTQTQSIYCSDVCKHSNNYFSKKFCCKECNATVTTAYGDKRSSFCCDVCCGRYQRRMRKHKERARLRSVRVETVDPFKVFDRDGWRCQICRRKTPRNKRGMIHPTAPELDHIVPLSVGGDHSYRNTQCACRSCNASKGNDVYGQIPMFAT